jgi:trans-2,3-dihydro-3-hydroxyanthranilate isomerase
VRAPDVLASQDLRIVLEEQVGDIVCVVRSRKGGALAANFDLPKLPQRLHDAPPPYSEIAKGIGLAPEDIGFDRHEPSLFTAGAPYLSYPCDRSRRSAAPAQASCVGTPAMAPRRSSILGRSNGMDRRFTQECSQAGA